MSTQVKDRLADYVPVSERIEKFYSDYPQGRILTTIVEHDAEHGFVLFRAEAYRQQDDASPSATGHAFENRSEGYVNKTSYIENCETSATGRALAILGYEIKRGIASREEMQKAERMNGKQAAGAAKTEGFGTDAAPRDQLFEQAEKLLAKLPEDKRKEKLGNLVKLSTEEIAKKVEQLAATTRSKQLSDTELERHAKIRDIKRDAIPEKLDAFMDNNFGTRDLESLDAEALELVHAEFVLPF